MGFWSGIKHAINSTLGTADFQSLDKIIKSQRSYAASDSILAILGTNMEINGNGRGKPVLIENISVNSSVEGSLRVKGIFKGWTTYDTMACLMVYEDGKEIASSSKENPLTGEDYEIEVDFSIKKGKTYTFYIAMVNGSTNPRIDDLKLCGQVVDLSMLEYTTH